MSNNKNWAMRRWAMMAVACLLLGGCKTVEYVPVVEKEVHHDSIYLTKVHRDSIYLHDSISVKEKGDTVWTERWHTRYVERLRVDTLVVTKTDSIPAPYPVIKEVPAELSAWQKFLIWVGILSLMVLMIFLGKWSSRFT